MQIIIKLPLFKAKITVLLGQYNEIAKHVKPDWDFIATEDDTYKGICGFTGFPSTKAYVYHAIINVVNMSWSCLAHEALHATNFILDSIGAHPSFADDEAQAYIMAHIISEVEKRIQKKQG